MPNVAAPEPYYKDDRVTLYCGASEDVLPSLDVSVDVLLTDPPYFNVKDEDWDRQWKRRGDFLDWLGGILDATTPLLAPSASVWVFAGPLMASSVEREVIDPRFRVLNSIRWVKDAGWHKKADVGSLRRYLSPWEAVILAERRDDAYGDAALALHKQVFAPLGRYIQQERERAGLTRSQLEVALGYTSTADPTRGTALAYRWEEGSSLPTAEAYQRMRDVLGPGYLRREYEDLRRPFRLDRGHGPTTDVWTFSPVRPYAGKHPCEKPLPMLAHMLGASARPGAVVLDPFAGSGATLLAARDADLSAIGIEKDERWCEVAATRLSEMTLDLGA